MFDGGLSYRGNQLLIVQKDPYNFGPGATVCFDLDGDGVFEREVYTDEDALYNICLDTGKLQAGGDFSFFIRSADGQRKGETRRIHAVQEDVYNPACEIPINCVPGINDEPEICTCTECPPGETLTGSSLGGYTHSYTPAEFGVELATGKLRWGFPVTGMKTRLLDFNFSLHHASLVKYDGPWGQNFSHSFNMMIVQTGSRTGQIITPDLRIYDISSEDGSKWFLPRGFFSKLRLDAKRCRWTLTHFSGLRIEFFQGLLNKPGYPISIRDPNGNAMRLEYNASGLLQQIVTDLHQVETLAFDARWRLHSFTDHIKRNWRFGYDDLNRLTRIVAPLTEFADIASRQEITEDDLPDVLVRQPRTRTLAYTDKRFPAHITAMTDQRGATPDARLYDEHGRVRTALINSMPVQYIYDGGFPLARLEETNRVTRVVDREGNVRDYEIHSAAGGPVDGLGRFGLRRKLTWTERGKGNSPLREGEPAYWEQRWLHDCNCLAPQTAVEPFSSDDAAALTFDQFGVPQNWPRTIYTYNRFRQVTADLYTDGVQSIRKEFAYQERAFGDSSQYSRMIGKTEARAFDGNSIYAGLSFVHTYQYDGRGNRVRHDAPTVTRGVEAPQAIAETWTYNQNGQVLRHTDPNGNITENVYYDGPSCGGDINTKGEFGGYLASVAAGAAGSADPASSLTTRFQVNSLGMITSKIDPNGFTYDFEYNNLQEATRWIEPPVTLRNGQQVQYETRCIYDGAGNKVMERRSNIDLDGGVPANAWIDRSMSYDDVNNRLSERVEVDSNDANDLITRYAYDNNDDLAITRKPEGNREFILYDERRLRFKIFYGVARGAIIDEAYPADKRAADLGATTFIGLCIDTYDARRNRVRFRDGRGNFTSRFFDFYNRQTAESDANGNGWVRDFDDDSNTLTIERGAVDANTGRILSVLERTYNRFDEAGRRYQQALDIDLASDERMAVDPDDGRNSSYLTRFDPGSRVVRTLDANGNPATCTYDAAGRMLETADALGNTRAFAYDPNSNVIRVTETELPGPGAGGDRETYADTYVFDPINRPIEQHIRGLNGNSIDHAWFFSYDSRNNRRLIQDSEDNFTLAAFDDFNRPIVQQRFAGDPLAGSPRKLLHSEWAYDRNSRVIEERARSDAADAASAQITRHAYDDLDRRIRSVFPDSDDPIDGTGDGGDGVFDRVETAYDANSNRIRIKNQREIVFDNSFDPGDRPTNQDITRPDAVPGTTRQNVAYDALNRVVCASNDFAQVERAYDPLSRLTSERQSIRLDGSGFANGWEAPVEVGHAYDRQSNRIGCEVLDGAKTDLAVTATFDALNRKTSIAAGYFGAAVQGIAAYSYIGPSRIQTKTLGNCAVLTRTYDAKRRIRSHQWTEPGGLLVGFEYGYDRMDNALFERFNHDNGLYDHFQYNGRYELTSVEYRSGDATPPSNPRTLFFYDDNFNRTQATAGDPFSVRPNTVDSYTANSVNEYTQIKRNGRTVDLAHDRAGNMTRLLLRIDPVASARWDALNLLFDIETGATPRQNYRYDVFRRRIASPELDGHAIQPGSRRYIYDGWEVIEERLFDGAATLRAAASRLERIYVNGREIDEPLLTAIDSNGDGTLGCGNREYYFLNNRLGSIMALLDADQAGRVLESYRYTVYGEPTVLPAFGNVYLFGGRRFDERAGLYYFRYRYYEPVSGRFVSRDPLGYSGGMHLYAYTWNGPTNSVDPWGLIPATITTVPRWTPWKEPRKIKIGDVLRGPVSGQTIVDPDNGVGVPGRKLSGAENAVITGVECVPDRDNCPRNCVVGVARSIEVRLMPDIGYVKGSRTDAVHEAVHARQIADRIRDRLATLTHATLCGAETAVLAICRRETVQKAAPLISAVLREWVEQNTSIHALTAGKDEKNPDDLYKKNPVEIEARELSEGPNPPFPEGVQPPKEFRPR